MSTPTLAPELRLDSDDDEPRLLGPEFDLPAEGDFGDERHAKFERERYDEQILAALVSP
jgi:hypothetical protein